MKVGENLKVVLLHFIFIYGLFNCAVLKEVIVV
jgi:hypothetical protein